MTKKNVTYFLRTPRRESKHRPIAERITDWKEVAKLNTPEHSREQASRCMDCGTVFCQWGCPIANNIPEWNSAVMNGRWQAAFELLDMTNVLPEITGRVCPAPCEYACVLNINDEPVTIRENELAIIEYGFENGLVVPRPPKERTGKEVAVIGSGPAGLSCAARLNRAGHRVVVFEQHDRIGGILRYGIPDFKMDKRVIDRRIEVWEKEGIEFRTNIRVGNDLAGSEVMAGFDAVCLAIGSRVPRDLILEGRDLDGIYFAMDFLTQNNQIIAGVQIPEGGRINLENKRLVIIGGGDTGADCVGTALRQGALSVAQIEIMPRPPKNRTDDYPWPGYPVVLRETSSHQEGGDRYWSVSPKMFLGKNGQLKGLTCVEVDWTKDENSKPVMTERSDAVFEIEADVAILAIGYTHPEHEGLLAELKLDLDERGNLKTDHKYMTSIDGIFAAGDAHRGQSLVVWAISEGEKVARCIDSYLMG